MSFLVFQYSIKLNIKKTDVQSHNKSNNFAKSFILTL